MIKRPLLLLGVAAATLFAASAADAAHVSWSVGINVAPVATVVSSGPAYFAAPVRYAPAGVVYSTVPAYAAAPVYAPPVAYDEPYVDPYVVASGFYAPPVVVRPYYRRWAPQPVPHAPWDHHDRWHHEVGYRR
ncbi:MAG TPA: hypothetical protein VGK95_00060 [Caldimonas sp.]|jgi:hypothetical protein